MECAVRESGLNGEQPIPAIEDSYCSLVRHPGTGEFHTRPASTFAQNHDRFSTATSSVSNTSALDSWGGL